MGAIIAIRKLMLIPTSEKPIMVLYSPQKAYTILDAFCGEYYYSELKSVFSVFEIMDSLRFAVLNKKGNHSRQPGEKGGATARRP